MSLVWRYSNYPNDRLVAAFKEVIANVRNSPLRGGNSIMWKLAKSKLNYSVLSLKSHKSSIMHEPHFGLRAVQV